MEFPFISETRKLEIYDTKTKTARDRRFHVLTFNFQLFYLALAADKRRATALFNVENRLFATDQDHLAPAKTDSKGLALNGKFISVNHENSPARKWGAGVLNRGFLVTDCDCPSLFNHNPPHKKRIAATRGCS